MSPVALDTAALFGPESERETFFKVLLHDDRNSFYIVSSDVDGVWGDTAIKRETLAAYPFDKSSSYYMTHNGFTGRRRLAERTRQLNALFFDLDCHGSAADGCEAIINDALGCIFDGVQKGTLPNPNIIVDSGRGLHLYYVLDRSIPYRFRGSGDVNEKGIRFFKDVQERLANVLDELLAGIPGIKVDRAVFDHTRVSRIPGTYNRKAGRYATLVSAHENYCHLSDLASYKPAKPMHSPLPSMRGKGPATILHFHPLMMSRLNKVSELQAYRNFDCEGTRELMSFVFYNTAVQIYSRANALERLRAFNAQFTAPLPQSELGNIVRTVDDVTNVKGEKGYYILKASTLARLLALTEKEMLDIHFFASKRMVERMEAKRKTKERRNRRDERILELYQKGCMTQQELAQAVGCSPRTVSSVLRKAGLTRAHSASDASRSSAARNTGAPTLPTLWESAATRLENLLQANPFAKKWQPCLWGVNDGEAPAWLSLYSLFESGVSSASQAFNWPLLLSLRRPLLCSDGKEHASFPQGSLSWDFDVPFCSPLPYSSA